MVDRRDHAAAEMLKAHGLSDGVPRDIGASEAEYDRYVREVIEASVQNRNLERAIQARESVAANADAVVEALSKTPTLLRRNGFVLAFRRARAARDRPILVRPPMLICAELFRCFLRPADYKRLVEPHIADMHEEYFACLAMKDERGAKWAVVRANLYVVPLWLWALLGQLVARVVDWIRI